MSQVITTDTDYEQYISSAMEEVYGKPTTKGDPKVDGDVKHCEGINDDGAYNMIYATLRLTGRIVTSLTDDTYNSVTIWGHRFEELQQFMKEQGFGFNGVTTWDRTDSKPTMEINFVQK